MKKGIEVILPWILMLIMIGAMVTIVCKDYQGEVRQGQIVYVLYP
jgi:hypothetical protein